MRNSSLHRSNSHDCWRLVAYLRLSGCRIMFALCVAMHWAFMCPAAQAEDARQQAPSPTLRCSKPKLDHTHPVNCPLALDPSNRDSPEWFFDECSQLGPWFNSLTSKLRRRWNPPRLSTTQRTVVLAKVNVNGSISDARLHHPSGSLLQDASVFAALDTPKSFMRPVPEALGLSLPVLFIFDNVCAESNNDEYPYKVPHAYCELPVIDSPYCDRCTIMRAAHFETVPESKLLFVVSQTVYDVCELQVVTSPSSTRMYCGAIEQPATVNR